MVADFGSCKPTCTAEQYNSYDQCRSKKSAGESCGGSSESGTCASGLCGGSYCCDADAAASSCSKPCEQSTGICSTLAAVGEACSSDADCYDTNANWCHTDTNLCAVHSEWGGRCVTNDHCMHDKAVSRWLLLQQHRRSGTLNDKMHRLRSKETCVCILRRIVVSARRVKLARGLMFQKFSDKLTSGLNMILSLSAWSPTSGGASRRARRNSTSLTINADQRRVRVNLAGDHLSLELVRPDCAAAATAAMRMLLLAHAPSRASRARACAPRLAAVGEACSSDADCYDTNANWCHTDTNLCAVHSEWGGRCVTNDHCMHDKAVSRWLLLQQHRRSGTLNDKMHRLRSKETCVCILRRIVVSARRVKLARGLMFQKFSDKLTSGLNMILSLSAWSPTSGGASRRARRNSTSLTINADQRRVRVNLAGDHLSLELVRPDCAAAATAAMRMPLPIAAICVIKVPGNASDRRAAITRRAPLRPRTQPRATRPRATQPMWEFPLHRRLRSPPPPTGGSAADKTPEGNSEAAKETKEKAQKTRDTMLNGVTDAKLKKKAKLLADAAISGKKVRKMSAKLTASDADTACSDYYSKAGISSSLGACIATATSRRRSLAATAYDVSVFFSEAEVDDSTLTSAAELAQGGGRDGRRHERPHRPDHRARDDSRRGLEHPGDVQDGGCRGCSDDAVLAAAAPDVPAPAQTGAA